MFFFRKKPFKCFWGEYENVDKTSLKYKGIKAINVADILGTVGRCHDNSSWSELKDTGRFRKIKQAMKMMEPLPAIKVYKVEDEYYVLDGHHRVMASREIGKEFLDAEIYEYEKAVAKKTKEYEDCPMKNFIDQTDLKGIILNSDHKYHDLLEYIKQYGSRLNENLSLKEVARHWYENDFLPFISGHTGQEKDKTESEIYCDKKVTTNSGCHKKEDKDKSS